MVKKIRAAGRITPSTRLRILVFMMFSFPFCKQKSTRKVASFSLSVNEHNRFSAGLPLKGDNRFSLEALLCRHNLKRIEGELSMPVII